MYKIFYILEKEMSFQEKSAWACLIGVLAVYGWYFIDVGLFVDPAFTLGAFMKKQIVLVVGLVILLIIGNAVAAATSRSGEDSVQDEREILIKAQAGDIAGGVAIIGSLMAAVSLFHGAQAIEMANYVLLAIVASEIVRNGVKIAKYRFWL